jgi:hypothetical protein
MVDNIMVTSQKGINNQDIEKVKPLLVDKEMIS